MSLSSLPAYSLLVPKELRTTHAWIPDDARLNGICVLGGPGSGKSRLMGRLIAYLDFVRGTPVVILDPLGITIDNFLHRIALLPRQHQERLWPRIFYVNMNARERIIPFPLLQRFSDTESLASIALRFLEVVRKFDPNLSNAAVEGTNALMRIGQNALMILAALNLPVTETASLLTHPEQWKHRFAQAKAAYPEVQPALDFILDFAKNKPDFRVRRSESFLNKIQMFLLDPTMRAMFCAATPGIDWAQVVRGGYAVLIDFRDELTPEYRRFKLLWVFMSLLTYLTMRGAAGRNRPVSFLIDELPEIVNFRTSDGRSVMADDIEKLVSEIARNHGVWLTLAAQGLSQFDLRIQKALGRMGTQMIGNIQDADEAFYLARQFMPFNPYLEKKRERVWMSVTIPPIYSFFGGREGPMPRVVDERIHEFPPEEYYLMGMRQFQELEKLTFLVKLATSEGNLAAPLRKMSIASIDSGLYLDSFPTGELRQKLTARHGFLKEDILAQIEQQSLKEGAKKQVKTPSEPAKLNTPTDDNHTPAIATDQPSSRRNHGAATPLAPAGSSHPGSRDNDFWERRTQ